MARTSVRGRGGDFSFAQVPGPQIERSVFNRSCGLKTTFDSGYLVPIFCDEALPGDTLTLRCNSLVRMTTPIYPLLENIHLDTFFFAVPLRLIWNNAAEFFGEEGNPGGGQGTPPTIPVITDTPVNGDLSDYIGIPVNGVPVEFCSFWHRAYNLVFNTWFRSEDLTNLAVVDLDDGPDTMSDYVLRRRTKRHDYFTSCLPFRQKGAAVSMELTGSGAPTFHRDVGVAGALTVTALGQPVYHGGGIPSAGDLEWTDPNVFLSVTALREGVQVQRFLERAARGGTRYTEVVRSFFGVVSPDARLQRPEFLGAGHTMVNVHPVAGTTKNVTATTPAPPYAALGAFATASVGGGFSKSFTEHCVIIGLVNVRSELTYQQGLERMFSRETKYDFYWPQFAHLSEQAVLNKELYYQNNGDDAGVFGYQERYAEYRYKPSRTSGRMRSTYATPLDPWHLGIEFGSLPLLNNTFIEENAPFSRVLAVSGEHQFFGDFWFDYRCARPMPTFSVPGLVDHF